MTAILIAISQANITNILEVMMNLTKKCAKR